MIYISSFFKGEKETVAQYVSRDFILELHSNLLKFPASRQNVITK